MGKYTKSYRFISGFMSIFYCHPNLLSKFVYKQPESRGIVLI